MFKNRLSFNLLSDKTRGLTSGFTVSGKTISAVELFF
jgi:hypothetical protein